MGRISKILTLHSETRPYTFLLVLFLLLSIPTRILEAGPNLSLCSRIFGEYCYSVGITRGVSSILHGMYEQALTYNILAYPVLGILLAFIIYDSVSLIKKKHVQKRMRITNMLIGGGIGIVIGFVIGIWTNMLWSLIICTVLGIILGAGLQTQRKLED